jgi:hypothetical protein
VVEDSAAPLDVPAARYVFDGAADPVIHLLDRVVHCVAGRVDGHGYLLSCLLLVCWVVRVLVRMLRSLAVCWSMACGPLPVSSRTDGS